VRTAALHGLWACDRESGAGLPHKSDAVAAAPLGAAPVLCAGQWAGDTASAEWKPRPGPVTERQHTARSALGLRVLERIVDGEAFRPRRHQQRIIGGDKQGWRHPPLVQQALHRQGTGQLHGVVGP
jgi:hypothetical protein